VVTRAGHIEAGRLAAWRLFLQAHSQVIDTLSSELEREAGLPLNWYEVLLYLDRAPDCRMRMHELADSLLLSRSAATRFVDRMVDAGLVRRFVCESDRRGTWVAATEAGREAFASATPVHRRGIQEHFTRHLSDRDAETLVAALERVVAAGADPA
jgi:DNA-binding MarR family transcriptional regulator